MSRVALFMPVVGVCSDGPALSVVSRSLFTWASFRDCVWLFRYFLVLIFSLILGGSLLQAAEKVALSFQGAGVRKMFIPPLA